MSGHFMQRLGMSLSVLSILGLVGLTAYNWAARERGKQIAQTGFNRIEELEQHLGELAGAVDQQRRQFENCKKAKPGTPGCNTPVAPPSDVIVPDVKPVEVRGIADARVLGSSLFIYYTDGSQRNAGTVVGPMGPMGLPGSDGKDGKNGKDGEEGAPGADGVDGADGTDGANGSDGTNGTDGANGSDGRGVASAAINSEGHLVLTYSDGGSEDVGQVQAFPFSFSFTFDKNTVTCTISLPSTPEDCTVVKEEPGPPTP